MTSEARIAEAMTEWLTDNWYEFESKMPGGYPDIDGFADHLAAVIAALPGGEPSAGEVAVQIGRALWTSHHLKPYYVIGAR